MPRRDLIILFILALLFNSGLAFFIREPGTLDDAYYYGGALRLVQGAGLTEPYLWNYLGQPTGLPIPSHLYWMPLTSMVSAAGMWLLGQNFNAARLPLLLFASLLPLVSYAVAFKTTGLRRHAIVAALLTIFCGFYAIYWGTTDAFGLYGLIGSLTLFAMGDWKTGTWKHSLLIGIGCGLLHLTRADGPLFLICAMLLMTLGLVWRRSMSISLVMSHLSFAHFSRVMPVIFGYLLMMLPWFVRNMSLTGNPLGGGGTATLWMLDYNDLFTYPSNLSPARYFAAGLPAILFTKWDALVVNLQHIVAEQGLIFLPPLIIIGLWQLRRQGMYQAAMLYAVLLYAAMTFAFTFPGPRGGIFHSGVALLPFYFSAALVGLDAVIDWVAGRLKHWKPDIAKRNFSGLLAGVAFVLTLFVALPKAVSWNGSGALFRNLTSELPDDSVIMSNNPPGFWVATGHPGVPMVNGDVPALLAVADKFDVDYVLLDTHVPPGLVSLYLDDGADGLRLVETQGDWKVFEVLP